MTLLTLLAAAPPNWTPEWILDRGKAWVDCIGGVTELAIAKIGVLALAILAVMQNVKAKAHDIELRGVKERLDRQSERIQANSEAVTAVALATPVKPLEPAP